MESLCSAKDPLCHALVMYALSFKLPFRPQVDASALRAGVFLLQEDENHIGHPDSYFSKVLKGPTRLV